MPPLIVLPPFASWSFATERQDLVDRAIHNPHPTDIVLDASVFSIKRTALIREILRRCSPILLNPVRAELEDLKAKPELAELRDIVFPGGILNPRFRSDERGVLTSYQRFSIRYASLLRWRRDVIDIAVRNEKDRTGDLPVGKARTKLIQNLIAQGIAARTIELANKGYRSDRYADEALAMFAVLSPILTGRDCFLYTADADISEQVHRMSKMLFEDYGAYLMARDFWENETRYNHRHKYTSDLFTGEAEAIGRQAQPNYLLPPPKLIKTCATTVIDVGRLKVFIWISARNMEPAISFQDQDPLGRKGDPGGDNDIMFSLTTDDRFPCNIRHHFAIGTPSLLTLLNDDGFGPIPKMDLFRAIFAWKCPPERRSRILSPFAEHQQRLTERAIKTMRRR